MTDLTDDVFQHFPLMNKRAYIKALVDVFIEYENTGKQPGAEKWPGSDRYRQVVLEDVQKRWAISTGNDEWEFPFSRDFVMRCWVAVRKLSDEKWEALKRLLYPNQLFRFV